MLKDDNRNLWRTRVERLLATDMSVIAWCEANKVPQSSMFKWIGYFADAEPDLFGGQQNIADRDFNSWIEKTRANMRTSAAPIVATPVAANPAFVRIDVAQPTPQHPSSPEILVELGSAIVRIPSGAASSDIARVLKVVHAL